jgi:hypothetical protein
MYYLYESISQVMEDLKDAKEHTLIVDDIVKVVLSSRLPLRHHV